jgi:4-alpha-glucanotransferase
MIVALSQIMQHSTFVKMSQIGHIFDFFEFWWIDRMNQVTLEGLFLLN